MNESDFKKGTVFGVIGVCGAPSISLAAQLIAKKCFPLVPVHTKICRIGGKIPQPELGEVNELNQTNAIFAIIS